MSYMLIGDSGTVVFTRTGTITSENASMTSKVTSNPVEGGGNITDHATLDPIKFDIGGTVTSAGQYATLETMWRNRDLLKYRGVEAYDNLLITSLQRTRSLENNGGYAFKISFQQITITSAAFVNLNLPSMNQQDNGTSKAASADKSARGTTLNGLKTASSQYVSYVENFSSASVNTSVAAGRTNPSYAGYVKGGG